MFDIIYSDGYFLELHLQIFKPAVNELEVEDYSTWVNVVWSLIVLEQYEEKAIDSVLNPNFISKLNFTTDNKGTSPIFMKFVDNTIINYLNFVEICM